MTQPLDRAALLYEIRIRLARDDMYQALEPVARHSETASYCLEEDDDEGLRQHLEIVVAAVKKAATRFNELRALKDENAAAAGQARAA